MFPPIPFYQPFRESAARDFLNDNLRSLNSIGFVNPSYEGAKILCVALCQGAALHYIGREHGIKDFDLWTFYERAQQIPDFPSRRLKQYNFGESKFGRHPADERYVG